MMNLRKRAKEEMAIVDQAVNRTQWTATPADVNAYYSRNRNQISEFRITVEHSDVIDYQGLLGWGEVI